MNKTEKLIFDNIPDGTTKLNLKDLGEMLNLTQVTVRKYINKLSAGGYITRKTIGKSGGAFGDATRETFITKSVE